MNTKFPNPLELSLRFTDREAVDDRAVNRSKLSVYTVNVSAQPAHINPVTSHEASFWHAFDKAAVFCHGQ